MSDVVFQSLAILAQAGLILVLGLVFTAVVSKLTKHPVEQVLPWFPWVVLHRYGLQVAFLVVVAATAGSLYFSEFAGLAPCLFCWYQRIFMYPLVVILGVAMLVNDRNVRRYVLPLTVIGMLLAAYHYYLQKINPAAAKCLAGDVSCATVDLEFFGYITIPLMSLTAFALVAFLVYYVGDGNAERDDASQPVSLQS